MCQGDGSDVVVAIASRDLLAKFPSRTLARSKAQSDDASPPWIYGALGAAVAFSAAFNDLQWSATRIGAFSHREVLFEEAPNYFE